MFAVILICFALLSFGQEPGAQGRQQPSVPPQATASPAASPGASPSTQARGSQDRPAPPAEEPPVVTKHEIRIGGRTLRYTATTGMMPIKTVTATRKRACFLWPTPWTIPEPELVDR